MSSSRPATRFKDIIRHIDLAESYVGEFRNIEAFQDDMNTALAVERCIAIISEAAVKLGQDAETLAPDIPWKDIRGMGNIIRHDYDGVDAKIIWDTIHDYFPSLRKACIKALSQIGEGETS